MKKVFILSLFAIMILLSIPALKLGGSARLGQLAVLGTFFLMLTDDLIEKKINYPILIFFMTGAVVLTLISMNSISPKFGEQKFFIKYFLVFPASFYVGYKFIEHIELKKLILFLEIIVFIFCLNALLIELNLMPGAIKNLIVSYRTSFVGNDLYLEYQGTFAEAGWFAMTTEATALFALLLRYDFSIWPKYKLPLVLLYIFVFTSLALSKNKTIWLALVFISLFFIIYKAIIALVRTNYYMPDSIRYRDYLVRKLSKLDTNKMLFLIIFIIMLFMVINTILPQPIISGQMLTEKLQHERGKAFMIVTDLLAQTHWIGGYGFGFVEAYFTLFPQGVIGLGEGTGMIFNSYLDVWLSVSILGLIFHLIIVYLSSSSRYYATMVIPMFFFIYANFNPAIGDEYYYIFMGMSYGVATLYHVKRKEVYA
jgi:hypothetical protein